MLLLPFLDLCYIFCLISCLLCVISFSFFTLLRVLYKFYIMQR